MNSLSGARRVAVEAILLHAGLLALTLPGALVLAGFDPPYSILKEAALWVTAYIGLSPLALLHIAYRRDVIGRKAAVWGVLVAVLLLCSAYAAWSMQEYVLTPHTPEEMLMSLRRPGYHQPFFLYLPVAPLTSFLACALLPAALVTIIRGEFSLVFAAVFLLLALVCAVCLRMLRAGSPR